MKTCGTTPTCHRAKGVFPRSIENDAVQVPAIVVSEAPGPDPETLEWVHGVIEAALWQLSGRSSPTSDQLAARLLRDALRYTQNVQGQLLQEHIDYIYEIATSYLVQSNSTRGEGCHPKWVRRLKGTRRFLYARNQELYRTIQALSPNVGDSVDWIVGGHPAKDRGRAAAVCNLMGSSIGRAAARHGHTRS